MLSAKLAERLGHGISETLHESDPDHGRSDPDETRLRCILPLQSLEDIDKADPYVPDHGKVQEIIDQLAKRLGEQRHTLQVLLFRQDRVPDLVATVLPKKEGFRCWAACVWIAEAAWRIVTYSSVVDDLSSTDAEMLRPLAARLRFLTLSEPFRTPEGLATTEQLLHAPRGIAERVLGLDSVHHLSGSCREARRNWLKFLDSYESQYYLSIATGRQLEMEFRLLSFKRGNRPLVVAVRTLKGQSTPTIEDERIALEVVQRHLLPRFDLVGTFRICSSLGRNRAAPWSWWLLTVLCAITATAATASIFSDEGWLGGESPYRSALAAASCYTLITAGVLGFGRRWAMVWLLRLPATAAVGLVVLLALKAWVDVANWWASGTLACVAYGYLLIEARHHGVGPVASVLRSAAVWLVAAVHSCLVCLVGLVLLAPVVSERGDTVLSVLSSPHEDPGNIALLLAMATSWCLMAGVVTQILWEDQPITAPLAHMHWRAEH